MIKHACPLDEGQAILEDSFKQIYRGSEFQGSKTFHAMFPEDAGSWPFLCWPGGCSKCEPHFFLCVPSVPTDACFICLITLASPCSSLVTPTEELCCVVARSRGVWCGNHLLRICFSESTCSERPSFVIKLLRKTLAQASCTPLYKQPQSGPELRCFQAAFASSTEKEIFFFLLSLLVTSNCNRRPHVTNCSTALLTNGKSIWTATTCPDSFR